VKVYYDVHESISENMLSSQLSYVSVHKATKILKFHPYCIHIMHELKEFNKGQDFDTVSGFKT
jgi:hypothetical protein